MRTITKAAMIAAAAVYMAACAETSARDTPSDIAIGSFDGRWRLDRQASDDVRARLLPIFEKNEKKWRRSAERFEDLPPPPGPGGGLEVADDGISDIRWMQRERQKEIQALIAMISPASQLDVQHGNGSIRISTDKGEGTRVVTPGESSSLFLALGGFKVSSTWQKGALLVESRGTGENKMRVVERYSLRGDTLEELLEVKIPNVGKQTFRMVYRR